MAQKHGCFRSSAERKPISLRQLLLKKPLRNQRPVAALAGASVGAAVPSVPVAVGAVVLPAAAFFFDQAFLAVAFLVGAVVVAGAVVAAGAVSFAGARSAAGGAANAATAKPEVIKAIAIFFMVIHPFQCRLISHIACTVHTLCSLEMRT